MTMRRFCWTHSGGIEEQSSGNLVLHADAEAATAAAKAQGYREGLEAAAKMMDEAAAQSRRNYTECLSKGFSILTRDLLKHEGEAFARKAAAIRDMAADK